MLVFPQWRPEPASEGCRVPRWMPAERFAPYVARRVMMPPSPPQIEDDESTGGSSPESSEVVVRCGWLACGARLGSVSRLSAHVARAHAHPHTDGLFYCHWAGCTRPQKGFNARYKMLVHVRTHTNERPHTCNQCSKSFSRAENLKIHLRSHSGEKPYVCTYEGCGKAYSNSSDRFKHTRTHTVDKPYCCKVVGCNKRYTDPSSLRKHVKTYKHFTPKETLKPDSSDDTKSPDDSCRKSLDSINYMHTEPSSPTNIMYSPARASLSPPYNPVLSLASQPMSSMEYSPAINQVTYIRPLEPIYPVRVPSSEMSYVEYSQMYEHAYRSYNSSSYNYPILRPTVYEKSFCYEETPLKEEITTDTMNEGIISPAYTIPEEDMPLNLIKCDKKLECRPTEELTRRTDMPLDLSIRIDVESL